MDTALNIHARGKLLITGEYSILDGAVGLAVPTQLGQKFKITPTFEKSIQWTSVLENGEKWIDHNFELPLKRDFDTSTTVGFLGNLITQVLLLNPDLCKDHGWKVTSKLEFNQQWGLGSSSTLVAAIAQWAKIDPYVLLEQTFGGSGYDIACAFSKNAITFRKSKHELEIENINFKPQFSEHIFFIYLNRKQNSRESIAHYKKIAPSTKIKAINEITNITAALIQTDTLHHFEALLEKHENITAKLINTKRIQHALFSDYNYGIIKSLGGWGGDFVLACGCETDMEYFRAKGYHTIIPYKQMVL